MINKGEDPTREQSEQKKGKRKTTTTKQKRTLNHTKRKKRRARERKQRARRTCKRNTCGGQESQRGNSKMGLQAMAGNAKRSGYIYTFGQ